MFGTIYFCVRGQNMRQICVYTALNYIIKNTKITDHINNNLFVHMNEFSNQLKKGIWVTQKINLFVHSNIAAENDLLGLKFNITLENDPF